MASFNTHVFGGVVVGTSVASISFFYTELDLIQSFAVFIMSIFGSIIPDLDSDSGKPLTLISGMISILLPALLLNNFFNKSSLSPEVLISYFAFSYLIINYGVCELIKKITVHRGIMHSVPFSILAAELSYLMFQKSGEDMATMATLAVFMGCIVHLILDELHSFYFKFGFIPMLNKSSGTAFKLYSKGLSENLFIYSLVFCATFLILM